MRYSPQPRIAAVDGLRGYAALSVILSHLLVERVGPAQHGISLGPLILNPLTTLYNGFHAVTIFFVLSGFVLTLPFETRARRMEHPRDARRWYAHRARRLLPLYVVSTVLLAFLWAAEGIRQLPGALTATFIFRPDTFYFTPNPPIWSLAVELWFCLAFPLLLVLARRYGYARVLLPAVVVGALTQTAGSLLTPWLGYNVLIKSPLGHAGDFLIGMTIAHLYARGALPRGRWVLPAGIGLLLGSCALFDTMRTRDFAYPLIWQRDMLAALGAACLLTAGLRDPLGRFGRLLGARWLRWTGVRCYSLYVWHVPLIALARPMENPARFALFALALPLVSAVSYELLEKLPMGRRRAPAAVTAMPAPAGAA